MKKSKSCGILCFRLEPVKSFLLLKHPKRFDLPKGHMKKGETERECALREFEEETGIPGNLIEFDPDFRFTLSYITRSKRDSYQRVDKTAVYFLARLKDARRQVVTSEHEDFIWMKWDPPHQIQRRTIDLVLKAVEQHCETGAPRCS